ncbi:MAG TPA: prepilin-type N-terminal cleavage/methylation domain-containing protein [Gaiellaceae bacterium]|jgi:prepilin-type N-terminal cleavage/methylation domain-containing protein|nr:prepilin-type N-terminal cleavage/methylation domain-containing protein [Gaiellaceae bacterium]
MGTRAREEEGFGLIELLIALIVLSIGILALFGAFNAGAIAIRRASNVSTAAALADQQMEGFRAMTYASIGLVAPIPTSGGWMRDSEATAPASQVTVASCAGTTTNQCTPSRTFTGPDGHSYELDTYVVLDTAQPGVTLKKVTITVYDGGVTGKRLSRETSSFAQGF